MLIYKITNLVNGKIYIGQTRQSLSERWVKHRRSKKTNRLYSAIKCYGEDSFKIEQIDVAQTETEINEKEIYWIKFYDSTNPEIGYNIKIGGMQSPCAEETKRKIGLANSKKRASDETKKKQSQARLGKKLSEETRKKMSQSRIGRVMSEETKQKLREKRKFYKHSPETLKKMSEVRKGIDHMTPEKRASFVHKLRVKRPGTGDKLRGVPRTQETKDRISKSLIGKKRTEEQKERMRLSFKGGRTGQKNKPESVQKMIETKRLKKLAKLEGKHDDL